MNKSSRTNWGFTLIEMLVVVAIIGMMIAVAAPSLISQQKPLKYSVIQVEGLLKTVNLLARANSGNPYRVRPVYKAGQYHLRVETKRNSTCSNLPTAAGWTNDPNKDAYLPEGLIITNSSDIEFKNLSKPEDLTICFDGRGMEANGGREFVLKDTQKRSQAYRAKLSVSAVGDISRNTFNAGGGLIAGGALN